MSTHQKQRLDLPGGFVIMRNPSVQVWGCEPGGKAGKSADGLSLRFKSLPVFTPLCNFLCMDSVYLVTEYLLQSAASLTVESMDQSLDLA